MAERALWTSLSHCGSGVRACLMGVGTGTRGPNVHYYQATETRLVALTIDDAPSRAADEFEKLLDLLKELGVRVTFQVISVFVESEQHKQLLRRAVAEGHQLTNHTTLHQKCPDLSEEAFGACLDGCQELLDELAPGATRWFRPPHGKMNATMRRVLLARKYAVAMGDCYSADPIIEDVDYHVQTLVRGARAGSVIILHCPEQNKRKHVLDVIPRIVAELRTQGLEFGTLDDIFPDAASKLASPTEATRVLAL